jgi:GH35 family endo-1,4-beta-xylanase
MTVQHLVYVLSHAALSLLLLFAMVLNAQPAGGANKFLGNLNTRGQVRSDFLNYWNQITAENETQWWSIEQRRDSMNWTGADRVATFARDNKIYWKLHALLTSGSYPGWMGNLSDSVMLGEIGEWMDAASERFPDVPMIDVVNEGHPHGVANIFRTALGGDGATGFDWIINAFKMARARWPHAVLIYNDYNNIEYESDILWTLDLIAAMKNANAPIDAIGCQANYAWKFPTATIKENIDRIAGAGLPIFISAYEIGQNNDTLQDRIMREQFPMFWNHPKIVGITYWGYVVGMTWRDGTGLLSQDGVERPALTWLVDYVKDNQHPPNDFPDLLNRGTGIAASRSWSPAAEKQRSTTRNSVTVPGLFDLQGRTVRSFQGFGFNMPPVPGMYLIKPADRNRGTAAISSSGITHVERIPASSRIRR